MNKNIINIVTILTVAVFFFFVFVIVNVSEENKSEGFIRAYNSDLSAEQIVLTFQSDANESCAEKKYEISESECLKKFSQNGDACRQKTAKMFPGKINTIKKILTVGNHFTSCVFEKEQIATETVSSDNSAAQPVQAGISP